MAFKLNAWFGFRVGVVLALALGACGLAALVLSVQLQANKSDPRWGPTTRADVRVQSAEAAALVDALPSQMIAEIGTAVSVLNSDASYASLLTSSQTLASGGKRTLVAYPDGNVILDTALPASSNTWANAQTGSVAANYNTRVTAMGSQMFRGGWGYERKRSNTTGDTRTYVSVRLGDFRNSQGTLVLSEAS